MLHLIQFYLTSTHKSYIFLYSNTVTLILVIYIRIILTAIRWIHFLELKNLNSMIFYNLRNTKPILALRNRHMVTKRRPLWNCHREKVYSDRDLYGVNSETLILSLQIQPFLIFEIENFVLDFWSAFGDSVPRSDTGASLVTVKRHGGWKSKAVAGGYIEDSSSNKR